MSGNRSFDWYQFSKINQVSPKLQQFSQLIRNSHLGLQLNKVPNSLRQKLLLTFQNASSKIQKQYQQQENLIGQLGLSKKVIGQEINIMKQQLQMSKTKIANDKIVIEQKKKIVHRLKQKIRKKTQQQNKQLNKVQKQSYFCPFCTRQDFISKNDFTFHMFNQHSNHINNGNQTPQPVITAQFKQFMLSLKDKEIQLMEMMLNKKKQIQTMELQYAYSQQLKKIKTQSNYAQRKSAFQYNQKRTNRQEAENEEQQLKGQSQYLFYQNSYPNPTNTHVGILNYEQIQTGNKDRYRFKNQYNQGTPFQIRNQENKNREGGMGRLPQNAYQQSSQNKKNDYYHIFSGDIAVSQIDNSLQSHKIRSQANTKPKIQERLNQNHQDRIQKVYTQYKSQTNVNKEYKLERSPVEPLQYKQSSAQSKLYNYKIYPNKQLYSPESPMQRKYETVYMPAKSNISRLSEGHIFNSGPLLDDNSGSSDYQDYFNHNQVQEKDEVQDEEIRIIKPSIGYTKTNRSLRKYEPKQNNKNKNSLQAAQISISKRSNDNNHSNVLLEYSKDKSMLQISNSKQKSSDFIELSNSFSKKTLQYSSNNNESINLSDLKLSKLERQKQKQRQQKRKEEQKKLESIQKQEQQQQIRKNIQSLPEATYNKSNSSKSNPSVLQQFKRDSEIQIKMQKISMSKTEKTSQYSKAQSVSSFTKVKMPQNIELMKTNPGVLQQFLYKPSIS